MNGYVRAACSFPKKAIWINAIVSPSNRKLPILELWETFEAIIEGK